MTYVYSIRPNPSFFIFEKENVPITTDWTYTKKIYDSRYILMESEKDINDWKVHWIPAVFVLHFPRWLEGEDESQQEQNN